MTRILAICALLAGSCSMGPALAPEPERCLVPSTDVLIICSPGFQGGIPLGGGCQAISVPECKVLNPQWIEWRDKQREQSHL